MIKNPKYEIQNTNLRILNLFVIWVLVFGILLSLAPQAKAAVPTFDVGLNPKMDQLLIKMDYLLCMIGNLHKKEYGPPPVNTCGGAAGTGSGLFGTLGKVFDSVSKIFSSGNTDTGLSGGFEDAGDIEPPDDSGGYDLEQNFILDGELVSAEEYYGAINSDLNELGGLDLNGDAIPDNQFDSNGDGSLDGYDANGDGEIDNFPDDWPQQNYIIDGELVSGTDIDKDGSPDTIDSNGDGKPDGFDINKDGVRDAISAVKSAAKSVLGKLGLGGMGNSVFGPCDSLDCMAWNIAKFLLSNFSQQVVNWVRTGNLGSTPLFVVDWERFLLSAADQASAVFLQELNLTKLCEPFGTEIKRTIISSSVESRRPFSQRARCTMSDVSRNFQSFFNDFNNGGWGTWIELTQVENNPFGIIIQTAQDQELAELRAVAKNRNEAIASNGFLSQKRCQQVSVEIPADGDDQGKTVTFDKCENVTPGKMVQEMLAKIFGAEVDQLNIANEMDQVLHSALQRLLQSIIFSAGGLISPGAPPPQPPPPPPPPPPGTTISLPLQNQTVFGVQTILVNISFPPSSIAQTNLIVNGASSIVSAVAAGSNLVQITWNTTLLTNMPASIQARFLLSTSQIALSQVVNVIINN